jgi:hypothetical protein
MRLAAATRHARTPRFIYEFVVIVGYIVPKFDTLRESPLPHLPGTVIVPPHLCLQPADLALTRTITLAQHHD